LQAAPDGQSKDEGKVATYVHAWKNKLRMNRVDKINIWNDCWQLYRGKEDWTSKDDWQSKIVLPKSWASVKQIVSLVMRLLSSHEKPWWLDSQNQDDLIQVLRAEQQTELIKIFSEKADYLRAFRESLESSLIMGLGIMKAWWGFVPRDRKRTQIVADPQTGQLMHQLINEQILEGQLFVRAVDPYNFFWLPGSRLNYWTGTLEEMEVGLWELRRLAAEGTLDPAKVALVKPQRIDEWQKQAYLRWDERTTYGAPSETMAVAKITEYYGPIVVDGEVVEENGHVITANDSIVLLGGDESSWKNPLWGKKPPYVGFSPLSIPFRTEGQGVIEMVRDIDRGLNKLANLSVDTLLYKLLPVFEVTPDAYENPEDFETGMIPGKVFRKNPSYAGREGIHPIQFEDVSGGTIQVHSALDRAHQEGALVSEIQQAIPRYRGAMTAEEISTKQQNQNSFFGAMAADIEENAIKPLVMLMNDLIFQFISTSTDERVASILGVDAQMLASMTKEQLYEMIAGDYKVKACGITEQLEKAEMLQNLVQLMNIMGQNAQAWMPYINQDELLRRVLEAFRPGIRDIEKIITDPDTMRAKLAAMQQQENTPAAIKAMPQMMQAQVDMQQNQMAAQQQAQQAQFDQGMQQQQQAFAEWKAQWDGQLKAFALAQQQQKLMMEQQQAQAAQQPQPAAAPQGATNG
jgi:hypothetical protein